MLITHPATGDLIILLGHPASPLQRVERTKAECIAVADFQRCRIEPAVEKFAGLSRLTCLDGASSNPRSERGMAARKSARWKKLAARCEVHMQARNILKTYRPMEWVISCLVNYSIALEGDHLEEFAAIADEVVDEWITVTHHPCTAEANAFKIKLLKTALRTGTYLTRLKIAAVMLKLPNGGAPYDLALVKKTVKEGIRGVLFSRHPQTWPRHRWYGHAEVLDHHLLADGINGLNTEVVKRFVARQPKATRKKPNVLAHAPAPAPDGDGHPVLAIADDDAAAALAQLAAPAVAAARPPDENEQRREEHRRSVDSMASLYERRPFTLLAIMRNVAEPQGTLLSRLVYIGSDLRKSRVDAAIASQKMGKVRRKQIDLRLEVHIHASLDLERDCFSSDDRVHERRWQMVHHT